MLENPPPSAIGLLPYICVYPICVYLHLSAVSKKPGAGLWVGEKPGFYQENSSIL
jgi:hypothetical protein